MPRGDGTGPNGMGPMTGGGFGYCNTAVNNQYGYGYGCGRGRGFFGARGFGRGMGYGRGFGRGYGFGLANNNIQNQRAMLEDEKDLLKSKLEDIENQLENLD